MAIFLLYYRHLDAYIVKGSKPLSKPKSQTKNMTLMDISTHFRDGAHYARAGVNHYKPYSLTRFLIFARYGCEEGDPIARKILRVHFRY